MNIILISYIHKFITEISEVINKDKLLKKSNDEAYTLFGLLRKRFIELSKEFDLITSNAMSKEFSRSTLEVVIIENRYREIYEFLNFEVFENVLIRYIVKYDQPILNAFKEIHRIHVDFLRDELISSLNQFPDEITKIQNLLNDEFNHLYDIVKERLQLVIEREQIIFTMDENSFKFEEISDSSDEEIQDIIFFPTYDSDIINKRTIQTRLQSIVSSFSFEEIRWQYEKKKYLDLETSRRIQAKKMKKLIENYLKIANCRIIDSVSLTLILAYRTELLDRIKNRLFQYISC